MSDQDSFRRFMFEEIGLRGEWVRLNASWKSVLGRHAYPPNVLTQLGQALSAVVLLSATIKFKGSLILQAQSEGPLHTLVAQATHLHTIRGLAQWRADVPTGTLPEIYGAGRLALTIQNEGAEPYQGIVGLAGSSLAEAIENYFSQSEQLPTRLWLAADEDSAAGLLIQELPSEQDNRDDWNRITVLADTLSERELLQLPGDELLYRLFNEEKVRLFESEPVTFRCTCSRERIELMLQSLGQEELQTLLKEQGSVEVSCEFCNRQFSFDSVDIHILVAETALPAPARRH